jgi:hypothetical protein
MITWRHHVVTANTIPSMSVYRVPFCTTQQVIIIHHHCVQITSLSCSTLYKVTIFLTPLCVRYHFIEWYKFLKISSRRFYSLYLFGGFPTVTAHNTNTWFRKIFPYFSWRRKQVVSDNLCWLWCLLKMEKLLLNINDKSVYRSPLCIR